MYQKSRINRPVNVPLLDLQALGADMRIYGEIDDPGMRHFNPAIAWHGGKLKIALRSCNFSINPRGSFYFRDGCAYSKTDVIYGDLNPDTLQVSNLKKLKLKGAPTCTLVCGLEDVRLFSRKDGMHAIGFESDRLTRSLHNASAKMAEYIVKGSDLIYVRTLDKPSDIFVEKNWSPTDTPSKEFDFTYSPTQVWKDGRVIGIPYKGIIHGGSQLLKQKDGTYISLVHDKVGERRFAGIYDRFLYRTYLARHDKSGVITHLTPPFTYGTKEKIEFAAGLVEHAGCFLMTLGIRDAKWAVAQINKDTLLDMLLEYKP